jgi:hypothetical protein
MNEEAELLNSTDAKEKSPTTTSSYNQEVRRREKHLTATSQVKEPVIWCAK